MINIQELKKYYPDLSSFDKSILREYLQYKILNIIFKSKFSYKLSFLGGTALKICYNLDRFSEDLDFDNFSLTEKEFDELSKNIKRELSLQAYEVEIKIVFKGAFRCYIKIPKILFDNTLSDLKDEKITIQVDTAAHNFRYSPRNFYLQKFDVFRNIRLAPADLILSQKIAAIFGRKRAKGRDFYDAVFLMGFTDFNFDYLDFKFGIKDKKTLKKELLQKTSDLDFRKLALDVMPFLMNSENAERVKGFREYLEQKL